MLGELYEAARYTAGAEALSGPEQEAARCDLCLLAGVAVHDVPAAHFWSSPCHRVMVGAMLARPVNGQESPTIFVPFEGFEAFGHILYSHELQPLAAIEKLAEVPPGETLVIVFGDPRVLDTINDKVGGWKKFQDLGGSILIACDYREPTRLQPWKLAVSGTKVVQHQPDSYQGRREECPLIKQGEQDGHPLFKDWGGPATNRPSYLQEDLIRRFPRERRPLSRLAVFPPSCWERRLWAGFG